MRPVDPRLIRRSGAVRLHLVVSSALGTLTALAIIAQAWFISEAVDQGFHGSATSNRISALVTAVLLCFVARGLISWLHQVAANRAALRVKSDLRREVIDTLLDGSSLAARPDSGHTIALIGPGLDALDGYFAKFLPQLVLMLTVPGLVLIVLTIVDPLSAVTIGLTLPLIVVFMVLVGLMTKGRTEKRWAALKTLNDHFADVLDGLVTLKIFGRSQTAGMQRVGEEHRQRSMETLRFAFLSSLVLEFFSTIAVALVAVSVGLRVLDGSLGLRNALFVLLLAPEAFVPVRQVGAHFHESADGVAAVQDVFTILESGRIGEGSLPVPNLSTASIEFTDVSVAYPGRDVPALEHFSAAFRPASTTALVGPSGGGKSTALGVLLGFSVPESGTVTVGGIDLRNIDPIAWRKSIAWVPQHPVLLNGTIGSNVALGHPGADRRELRTALDDAGAASLPLDRAVLEQGMNLSAGEIRRIGVARALLRARLGGARVLLLDEPTAGLDQVAEDRVLESVMAGGLTVIVVAHRSAAITLADRVVPVGDRIGATV